MGNNLIKGNYEENALDELSVKKKKQKMMILNFTKKIEIY